MRISTDEMNDIIRRWVDEDLPLRVRGFESEEQSDAHRDARDKRFFDIVFMSDDDFRALFLERAGIKLSPMNPDGSYHQID